MCLCRSLDDNRLLLSKPNNQLEKCPAFNMDNRLMHWCLGVACWAKSG